MPKLGALVIKAEIRRGGVTVLSWAANMDSTPQGKGGRNPDRFDALALSESYTHDGTEVELHLWWRGGLGRDNPNGPPGEVFHITARREQRERKDD